jgi:hypothetical protein
LVNVKSKIAHKIEVYCVAGHEDIKHAKGTIGYRLMDGYKNKNHIITCDKKIL